MKGRKAICILVALLAALTALAALPANAQTYPDRPVRIVLPFGAGGVADVSSRIIADKLGERLGQRFVIENMPGPGGIAAGRVIATAAPDGHTLGLLTNGTAISVRLSALGASTVERANENASHAAISRHPAVRAKIHGGEMSRSRSSPCPAVRDATSVLTSPPMTGFVSLASV